MSFVNTNETEGNKSEDVGGQKNEPADFNHSFAVEAFDSRFSEFGEIRGTFSHV